MMYCPNCRTPNWQIGLDRRTVKCCHCCATFHLRRMSVKEVLKRFPWMPPEHAIERRPERPR